MLLYRCSFYHTLVNLVNSGSPLITHCNLLCSFHRPCTIFGQVNLNKRWSNEACLIVLHRVVDARRAQCAPRASYLGSLHLKKLNSERLTERLGFAAISQVNADWCSCSFRINKTSLYFALHFVWLIAEQFWLFSQCFVLGSIRFCGE